MSHLLSPSSPAARCYNGSAVSVPSGTDTAVAFPMLKFDVGAPGPQWSAAAPTRLACQAAGVYLIGFSLAFAAAATGAYRLASVRLNGTQVLCQESRLAMGAAQAVAITSTTLYALAVGDYVEVVVRQDSGGALPITASPTYSPDIWWTKVA